jgi:uncharacterized protein YcfL
MKKLILILFLLLLTGCTNNQWASPEQNDPKQVVIIQYNF